jgi:hypothetical protein
MRYLTPTFAVGALRRGRGVEQFLGAVEGYGVQAIRWVTIDPWGDSYRVGVHTAQDLDEEHLRDLVNLPPLGPSTEEFVGQGVELGSVADEADAIELAERLTGARADRWVNFGVAGEDYADFVRARRLGADPPVRSLPRSEDHQPPDGGL